MQRDILIHGLHEPEEREKGILVKNLLSNMSALFRTLFTRRPFVAVSFIQVRLWEDCSTLCVLCVEDAAHLDTGSKLVKVSNKSCALLAHNLLNIKQCYSLKS